MSPSDVPYDVVVYSKVLLLIAVSVVLVLLSRRAPIGVVIWFLGPLLGMLTIFLSASGVKTSSYLELLDNVYRNKLLDVYLLAVFTSAAAVGDTFQLAAMSEPRNHSAWSVILVLNVVFLVYMSMISANISLWIGSSNAAHGGSSVSHADTSMLDNVVFVGPHRLVWYYLFLSVANGFTCRYQIEKKNYDERKRHVKLMF